MACHPVIEALLGLLMLASACSRLPADLEAPEPPWPVAQGYPTLFRTEGNRIIDLAGQPRILRGVAVPEVVWLAQRQDAQIGYFDRQMFRRAAEWRSDIVRLSVLPALYRAHGPRETLRVLDHAVAYAKRYGLYLIICFHGIGYPPEERYRSLVDIRYGELYGTSQAEIADFWRRVAERYRTEPTVAFYELLNEPLRIEDDGSPDYDTTIEDWRGLRDWAEGLVDQVRAVDPGKPIIIGGLEFGYNLRWAVAEPVRRPNIAYATHPYAGNDWRTPWQVAFLDAAAQLPVLATEFGWGGDHPETWRDGQAYGPAILEAFDRAGIGWTAWSFSHNFPPSLLAHPRSGATTAYGEFIRQALLARAGPLPPLLTGPRPGTAGGPGAAIAAMPPGEAGATTGPTQAAAVAPVRAPPAPAAPPARPILAGRRLDAAGLRVAITGNTEAGDWGAILYRPDGSMLALVDGNRFPGRWRIDAEGAMCQTFPHNRGGQEVCFEWWLDGDRLSTFAPATGEGAFAGTNRIEAGNPRGI